MLSLCLSSLLNASKADNRSRKLISPLSTSVSEPTEFDSATDGVSISASRATSVYVLDFQCSRLELTKITSESMSEHSVASPEFVSAADRHILETLRDLRDDCRIGPVGLITHVFNEDNASFAKHRTEYFKDSSNSIANLLDTLAASPQGSRKLRQWLQTSKGASIVHGIVGDEMDAVTAYEKLDGLKDITPTLIRTWDVCGHEKRAPFTVSILTSAAQTERAKKENTVKLPDGVSHFGDFWNRLKAYIVLGGACYREAARISAFW